MTRPPAAESDVVRRFLVLTALRWVSPGLLIPVLVLLLIDRGLSLTQVGIALSAQGLMVMLLELPTGGLADAIGRRRVLLFAGVFDIAAVSVLIFSGTLLLFWTAFALQGVYRALDSGPLESWYVDTSRQVELDPPIERGLAAAGTVIGLAIGAGSLISSGLVAMQPLPGIDPLVTPLLVVLLLRGIELVVIAVLMTEPDRGGTARRSPVAISDLRAIVAGAVGVVRASKVLLALVIVDFLWGFGMTAFESFTPVRLESVLGSVNDAAAMMGPASTAGWVAAAAGAALVQLLRRRWSAGTVGAALRLAQGATVAGIGLAIGPVGVVAAFVATMLVHGAANPVHQGLVHRAVPDSSVRTTVVSAHNLAAQAGGTFGGIALGSLADAAGLSMAILAGAFILAVAAPLYLVGRDPAEHASADHVAV